MVFHNRRVWRPAPRRQKLVFGARRVDNPAFRSYLIEQDQLVVGPPGDGERGLAFALRPRAWRRRRRLVARSQNAGRQADRLLAHAIRLYPRGMAATFPTTHTGSLPRPEDLTQMLQDREESKPTPGIEPRIQQAVKDILQKQRASGLDIVNDGEMGKI